jgi:Flp pilus assembly protein TadB
MDNPWAIIPLVIALVFVVLLYRNRRTRRLVRERLVESDDPATDRARPDALAEFGPIRPFVRPHPIVPWFVALVVGAGLYFIVGLSPYYALAFTVIVGLLGGMADAYRVGRLTHRIEAQLADAIDLMVAGLRAGAGVFAVLETASAEVGRPLRPRFEELVGRIRLGDDPQTALKALEARVPLETFRLFAGALSVHWEVGGSLAATLANVGRVIRDRVEIARRVRTLGTQARLSTIVVMVVTYFIALIVWRTDPERMRLFAVTQVGQALFAGAIALQAIGIAWSARLSRTTY